MNDGNIKKIISDKVSHIGTLAEKVGKHFDKDTIHDFRVEVKRLRSFLRLLRSHSEEPKLKMTKKFKNLYHIAGDIRDTQLELDTLNNEKISLPQYKISLHGKIGKLKSEWNKRYSDDIVRKMHDKLMANNIRAIHPALLERFFSDKLAAIKKLPLSKSPSDDQVHEARKQIKDILYTSKLAKKEWKAAYKKTKNIPVNRLGFIADAIGNFNDERLMLEHLNSFASTKIGKAEEKSLNNLCDEEAGRLMEEKQDILSIIKEFSRDGKDKLHQ